MARVVVRVSEVAMDHIRSRAEKWGCDLGQAADRIIDMAVKLENKTVEPGVVGPLSDFGLPVIRAEHMDIIRRMSRQLRVPVEVITEKLVRLGIQRYTALDRYAKSKKK